MTNLKKLRAINLFIILFFTLGLLSCARAPHKSLFTDKTINENKSQHFPIIIVSDDNFTSPVLLQYLERTKKEFPQTKFILLLTDKFQSTLFLNNQKALSFFDASLMTSPIAWEYIPEILQKKPVINSHIYDLRNDERFLDSKTSPFLNIESEGQSVLLLSFADIKLSPHLNPTDEDEAYRFVAIEPMNALLRARKELRKKLPQSIGFISTEDDRLKIEERKHDFLNYTALPFLTADYFLVKNKKIQLCEWFYKATDDCFQNTTLKPFDLSENIIQDRVKLLEKNQERKEATYMGEEIQSQSQSLTPSATY